MEDFRRKLAQNSGLYPDLVPLRKPSNPTKASQGIAPTPGSSTQTAQGQLRHPKEPIEISSDSEDEVQVVSPPLRIQPPNRPPPLQAAQMKPTQPMPAFSKPPVAISRPKEGSYPHMATAAPPSSSQDRETFQLDVNVDPFEDRMMTQAEAEKALQDFVADAYNDTNVEYTKEQATVEGFKEGVMLLPHQVRSRQWMAERESGRKRGGILADDMGLGKTISTTTRILEGRPTKKDKAAGWSGTTLVVAPVALVGQWENEIKKFTSGLRVIQHHGQSRTTDPRVLENAHVVITSYSVVASEYGAYGGGKDESKGKGKKKSHESDSDDDSDTVKRIKAPKRGKQKDALFRVQWWRIVLDEAHNIKNRNTKSAIACCALEAKNRWCLTGTPMQNNVEEIFSLIKFLRIPPLDDWQTFNSSIAKPVKAGKPVRAIKRLQVVLGSIMLRRTKTTLINGKPIVDLPARLVNIVECDFDRVQREFYNSVEQKVADSLEQLQQGDMRKAYTSVLVLLLRLRQACNHPALISKDYKNDEDAVEPKSASQTTGDGDDDEGDDLAALLGGLAITRKPCQVCQKPLTADTTWQDDVCLDCEDVFKAARKAAADLNSDLPPHSSKTRMIVKILKEIEARGEGEKTIIFSQFTSMLDLIEPFLRAEGIKFVRYDGSMNKLQRDQSVEKISNSRSTKVILISFKAGSTGLNLTCCNNVILVDPWWNPALEDQAFDRAHRFGQKRAVNIHKLCVPESVEQRILELQEKKRALASATLSGDKVKNTRLGLDELVALFRTGHDDDDE